jgi:hypothetical protein
MLATDILKAMQARPFITFRMHMADGRTFDVPHPDQMMLTPTVFVVGVKRERQPLSDSFEIGSVEHVVNLEPAPTVPTTGNGAS